MKDNATPLSPEEISHLEDILFDDRYVEDSLDYFGIHGMLCAFAVGPVQADPDTYVEMAFGQSVDKSATPEYENVRNYLQRVRKHIGNSLDSEEPIELPNETYEDPDAMRNWAAGFVEAFMAHESAWFQSKQDLVAELLLPIMAVSDLFDDEDFNKIKSNPKLMAQLSEQIPEVLTDLYLLFHSGE